MTAIITVRIKVADVAKAKAALSSMSEIMNSIAAEGKKMGAIHHRFLESSGEIVVHDEWDSAESFQKFFSSNDKIKDVMMAAGAMGEPKVEVLMPIQTSDSF